MVVNTTSIVGQCTKLIEVLTAVDTEGEFNIPHLQKNTIEGQRIAKQVRIPAARLQMPRQHTSESRAQYSTKCDRGGVSCERHECER